MPSETEIKLERARRAFCKGKDPMVSMRYQGRYVFTGIFVFLGGLLLLLNTLGMIPWKFWNEVWVFWPALLVLFGVRIIFGRNRTSDFMIFAAGLSVFIVMVAYGLIRINSPYIRYLPANIVRMVQTMPGREPAPFPGINRAK